MNAVVDVNDAVDQLSNAVALTPGPNLACSGSYVEPTKNTGGDVTNGECRMLFSADVEEKSAAALTLHNHGTTALYYQWEKVTHPNVLGTANNYEQRFFFDTRPRSILPGDKRQIPMHFVSAKPGIFLEEWKLSVLPKIQNPPTIVLHGTAVQEDRNKAAREALEAKLEEQSVNKWMRGMMLSLVARVHTTHTAVSNNNIAPINQNLVVQEVLCRMVDGVVASCEAARKAKGLPEMPLIVKPRPVEEPYVPRSISAPVKGQKPKGKPPAKDNKKKGSKDAEAIQPLPPLDDVIAASLAPAQFSLARHHVLSAIDEMAMLLQTR